MCVCVYTYICIYIIYIYICMYIKRERVWGVEAEHELTLRRRVV